MMYALYLSAYHERKFWFSNRQVRRKNFEHMEVVLVFNFNLSNVFFREPKYIFVISMTSAFLFTGIRKNVVGTILRTQS